MFEYPNKLNIIFDKLNQYHIRAIIVGGYVRDYFLGIESKDIDIELYNVDSLEKVEKILREFGKVNSVGKSFGVVKLLYGNLDLDFSLPRSDSKTAAGHKGFEVAIYTDLDFKSAAKRRDFTMNAIGYDVIANEILDPYNGIIDLNNRLLRAVDLQKFPEDPLRVLRAVTFATRFNLKVEEELFLLSKKMIEAGILKELPKERIFEEIKKLLLKSKQPSKGIKLLKELSGFRFFDELQSLHKSVLKFIYSSLDRAASFSLESEKEKLLLMLALLTSQFSKEKQRSFLQKLTNEKEVLQRVEKLTDISFDLSKQTNYSVYKLATQTEIAFFSYYLLALYPKEQTNITKLTQRAKQLGVYHKALPPLIEGKDLIALGLKPSKEFSKILNEAYEKQMREEFHTKEEAMQYLDGSGILS
ncbi:MULTISPECIES: CCA tRNA nucleotidyltransferase [Sulfurimonas]|uniref:CCA tRNA nucleotidyltransferase n=1 Tax=Sulfurimonas TaxID=202746 RepID=UPI001264AED9|nr:CCA tRNA nucleotidyltransferase [Sulfurimonas indica]